MKKFFLLFLVFLLTATKSFAAVLITEGDSSVDVKTDTYIISISRNSGAFNMYWNDGTVLIKNAYALWRAQYGDESAAIPAVGGGDREFTVDQTDKGKTLTIMYKPAHVDFETKTVFTFFDDKPYFLLEQFLINRQNRKYRVSKAYPLIAETDRGGSFFPGADPDMVFVLENGYKFMFDFYVRVVGATEGVYSNWNAAYFDRNTSRTSHFGFISTDKAFVSIRSAYDPDKAPEVDDMKGLTSFKAEASYDPASPIGPGKEFAAEILFVGVDYGPLPHPTLEAFADAVGEHYGYKMRDLDIPTGWNAWASKYHHDLTQDNMYENAKWAAEKLLPFGMTTFQIDDGYQIMHGDWFPGENFSKGMDWIAGKISELGFTPGIWSQPYCINEHSQLAKDHPDWIAPKSRMGEALMPGDWLILDPTNPDVEKWLHDTYSRYRHEWGFKVLKLDFIYFVQLAEKYFNPNMTKVEAYRNGMQIIKDAAGPDAFLIMVGVPVANSAGVADSLRLGLDITPEWQDDEGFGAQGVKPMVRNLARRYYLNRRIWINHPDMFYMGSPEEDKRWGVRITPNEALTYATLASITGGIVKIGDTFIGLDEEQTNILRRLIPVYPATARPIDLFESLYPRIWHLPISAGGMDYDVITLFNWGRNRRWGKLEEEGVETITADLALMGMDPEADYLVTETWTGTFQGITKGKLVRELDPRTTRVYALRKLEPRPQFIFSNRHITQGGIDIETIKWDDEKLILYGKQKVIPDYDYKLMFHVPKGFEPTGAEIDKHGIEIDMKDRVATIEFSYDSGESKARTWQIRFKKAE